MDRDRKGSLMSKVNKQLLFTEYQYKTTTPDYYKDGDVQCFEAIRACMSREEYTGFLRGNVMKYMWRYRKKNGIEDLEKAQWYLTKLKTWENDM